MLAFVPQTLRGEVVDRQRAIQVAHSGQWHPAGRGTGVTWAQEEQGWKHTKDQG